MTALISDDIVEHFAVIGEPDQIAQQLVDKYGRLASRLSIYAPYFAKSDVWSGIIADIKRLQGR